MKTKIGVTHRTLSSLFLLPILLQISSAQTRAQDSPPAEALARWIQLDAPPGWEHLATDELMKALPGWSRDAAGNLMLRKGTGTPRRVIACGLDRPGFAVTEITSDGFIRLRESGAIGQHPLWVQFHEGQRIRILTRAGRVPGVVGVKTKFAKVGVVTGKSAVVKVT